MPEHRPRYARRGSLRTSEVIGHYRRVKLSPAEQVRRAAARRLIIQAANRWMAQRRGIAPFTARSVQRAVQLVRFRGLVDDRILAVAGYNAA
jgi:hypothetical protein